MTAERFGGTGCLDIHASSFSSTSGGMVAFTGLLILGISIAVHIAHWCRKLNTSHASVLCAHTIAMCVQVR